MLCTVGAATTGVVTLTAGAATAGVVTDTAGAAAAGAATAGVAASFMPIELHPARVMVARAMAVIVVRRVIGRPFFG